MTEQIYARSRGARPPTHQELQAQMGAENARRAAQARDEAEAARVFRESQKILQAPNPFTPLVEGLERLAGRVAQLEDDLRAVRVASVEAPVPVANPRRSRWRRNPETGAA